MGHPIGYHFTENDVVNMLCIDMFITSLSERRHRVVMQ